VLGFCPSHKLPMAGSNFFGLHFHTFSHPTI
jgi:hypothetical protein